MSTNDAFGRTLSDWLHEEAEHRVPDHLGEVLVHTAATRQRPWWSSPERWLPMQATFRSARLPRTAWLLIVLALLLALGATAIAVGSQFLRPIPSPFGTGTTGAVLYATMGGDIHAIDTATNRSRALIAGPEIDSAPISAPDGTTIAFLRRPAGASAATIMIANPDGTGVRSLDGLASEVVGMEWSPDSARLAVSAQVGGHHGLWILAPGALPTLVRAEEPGTEISLIREPHWRPGGTQLVFLGGALDTFAPVGLFTINADGTGLRVLVAPTVAGAAQPSISPDGSQVAYIRRVAGRDELHLVAIDSGVDTTVPFAGAASDQRPQWSPDGRQLVFERYTAGTYRLAIGSVDGGEVVDIGPAQPYQTGGAHVRFSPDGTKVLAYYEADGSSWVLDPADGSAVRLDEEIHSPLSWQAAAR